MGNNGIEDILIGQNYKKEKKKGRGVVVFIILLLLCALIALVYIYYQLTNNQVSTKELFLKAGSKIDFENISNVKLLDNLMENIVKKNSETETKINFSTTMNNEEFEDIDVSKFVIEINGNNDAMNKKSFNEMIFNYSGNKVYGLRMLFDENKAALHADEVTDKYVALNYDSMKNVLGIDIQKSDITNFIEYNKVQLNKDEFKIAVGKYANLFTQYLLDTSFTVQENIVINKNSNQVNVTGYSMKLTQDELKASLLNVLTELKLDDNLLNKFITGTGKTNVIQTQNEITLNAPVDPTINSSQEVQINRDPVDIQGEPQIELEPVSEVVDQEVPQEGEESVENVEHVEGEEPVQEEPVEAPQEVEPEIPVEEPVPETPTVTIEPVVEPEKVEESKEYGEFLLNILAGRKVEMSLDEAKLMIDEIINFVKESTGDGIEVIFYASEDKVEKITITLPNANTIDVEFILTSVQETNVKLTYLYKGNDSGLEFLFGKEELPIYQDDVLTITEVGKEDQINGYALEIVKTNRDANLTIKGTLSFIEDEKINEKIIVDLVTEGTSNSILVKNNLVLTHSTSEGETIATFDNKVRFSVDPMVDSLNQENSIFLDEMDEEQRKTTVDDIKLKLENIKETKKDNLSFIDTNTNSSIINSNIFDQVTSLTRDDARNLIVQKVSQMMTDAVNNEQEFTIQNLQGLEIEGYVVGTSITDTEATIVIGMYTFKIDTNFNLTDVE